MNSRERLIASLNHVQPDRTPVDLGSAMVTGMHVSVVDKLRKAVLGDMNYVPKVIEPYQMLGEIDDELAAALKIDVAGVFNRNTFYGFPNTDWKPFTMFDGTKVLVPGDFNLTEDEKGDLLMYPQGDTSVPPCARMPKGGVFFDSIARQEEIVEEKLDPRDNTEDFSLLSDEDIEWYRSHAERYYKETDRGLLVNIPGAAFGDISHVPAPWLKHTKGIREMEEWYISTVLRPDYIKAVFEKQLEIATINITKLMDALGDMVQAAFWSGADFGSQRGLLSSLDTYRSLFKPFHIKINDLIHRGSSWKTFMHSCGAISELIPELIEVGFDVLNPVQCSADNMEPEYLKREFGKYVTFWGGGVNTQKTLPFGTPDEVYAEVTERLRIFGKGGGFVFCPIHNVQAQTPIENLLAMFKAVDDFNG